MFFVGILVGLCITVVLILDGISRPFPQALPALQITSPPDGTTVVPGDSVTVSVKIAPQSNITAVVVIGSGPIGYSETKTLTPLQFTLSFSVKIPTNTQPGRYRLFSSGVGLGTAVDSAPIILNVERADPLVQLHVEPTQIAFERAGQEMPLRVIGTFANGAIADLTRSSRTSYSSNGSNIAVVNKFGSVIAAGAGSTTIAVRYGDQTSLVTVSVPVTIKGDLNGDGKVDQDDLNVIIAALNSPAANPFDARDLNQDGVINVLDATQLVSLCTSHCNTINIPPDVSQARPRVSTLWPPDHRMASISILGVTDPDGDSVTVRVDGISQDEPTMGLGDGDTCPDGAGVGSATAQLRAERGGTGNGRVYTIFFTAQDSRAGKSRGTVQVCVPHDQGHGGTCEFTGFHSKPAVDSTVCNP